MFQTNVEKIETHILCSMNFIFRKMCRLSDNVEKYCRAGQVTDENMASAHYMLGAYGYKHMLRIRKNYCFSTITTAVLPRLNITSYVHCLSY